MTTQFTYQWLRDSTAINGATSANYRVLPSDVGHTLFVQVTATNNSGSTKKTSAGVPIVTAATPPVNTVAPAISQAVVGQSSASTSGTWTGTAPITYTYQWQANGANIGGATSAAYTPVPGDLGKTLSCSVTAHNAAGNAGPVASNSITVSGAASAPTNTAAPVVNRGVVGLASTCTTGTWSGSPTITYAYQWKVAGANVGTNANSYTPVSGDAGKALTCVVTATNAAGAGSTASNAITVATSGGDIYVTNRDELFAAVSSPTSAGKTIHAAAGDYGTFGFYNFVFDSNPIVITGQADESLVRFQWQEWAGSSGIHLKNCTVYSGNASASYAGIWIHGDRTTSQTLTFTNVVVNTGTAMGTQTTGGWFIRDMVGANITINGRDDWTRPDIWGTSYGIAQLDCDGVTLNGVRAQNIGINAFQGGGISRAAFNRIGAQDQFWGEGDHPNGIHLFGGTYGASHDVTITDSGFAQGVNGNGTQCYFFEYSDNVSVHSSWGYDAVFPYACSNAGGSDFVLDRSFLQGITGGGGGGTQITRGASVDAHITNNTLNGLNNFSGDGANPGYVPAVPPGTNTIIGLASHYGDWSAQETWAAANPTAIPHP